MTPTLVVERFLDLLRTGDIDGAAELLGTDVEYINVGLPTVRGRERVRRLFRALSRDGAGFDVYIHAISADGPTVLTERTDVLKFRRMSVPALGLRALRRPRWLVGTISERLG